MSILLLPPYCSNNTTEPVKEIDNKVSHYTTDMKYNKIHNIFNKKLSMTIEVDQWMDIVGGPFFETPFS